jgi:hypothetical protein
MLAVLGFGAALATPALAMDTVCQSLFAMQIKAAKTPFHIYMTEQRSFGNQTLAKAGAQLGLTGAKKSEEISTGKDVYVLNNGKWIDMQTNFFGMSKADPNDPDVKKMRETARCHTLPDTMAAGQPASGYEETNSATGIDSKVWVSKISHLPLKAELTNNDTAMKTFTTMTYDYRNVQAPAGAMTMQQMMSARHH